MNADRDLPRVDVLTLGGTIAMTRGVGGGLRPAVDGEALIAALPELAAVARIEAVSFSNVPSPHLSFADLVYLARTIEARFARGADGVVVVQGTDTIEVTTFVLDLLVPPDRPVIVTGAMRAGAEPGADGQANLLGAVRVAADAAARGLGALAVFGDAVHSARFVGKSHTVAPAALTSYPGPLGWIIEGRLHLLVRPERRRVPSIRPNPDVATAVYTLGADIGGNGRLVTAAMGAGADGLVVLGMGAGHVAPGMVAALEAAATECPVILARSVADGPILEASYGYAGAEMDLLSRGLIGGGWLNPRKAHALLSLLIMGGTRRSEISDAFQCLGAPC